MNHGSRLLIVEDEALVADDLEQRLTRLGYQVAGLADNGVEALRLASESRPDLVLSDIQIKGPSDGIQVAGELHRKLDIPVVFLTAHADEATFRQAKASFPYGYILKPYGDTDLRTAIEIALIRHGAEQKVRRAERLLDATLRSIGEAVIATDTTGGITFLNPAAEVLLGVQATGCLGQELGSVLRIEESSENIPETMAGSSARTRLLISAAGPKHPVDYTRTPILDAQGRSIGEIRVLRNASERHRHEAERERLIAELQSALANVKTLGGLLPICAWCKKIRDDQGYWEQIESYLGKHSKAGFTHGICPECSERHLLVRYDPEH